MKIAIFLIYLTILFSGRASAESITDYRKKIDVFFGEVNKNKVSDAVEKLLLGVPYSESRVQAKVKFSIAIEDIIRSEGNFRGYDIIFEKKVTPNIVYIYGFSYLEKSPIKFEFVFRKLDNDWIVSHMNISVEAAKDIRYAIVNKLVQVKE